MARATILKRDEQLCVAQTSPTLRGRFGRNIQSNSRWRHTRGKQWSESRAGCLGLIGATFARGLESEQEGVLAWGDVRPGDDASAKVDLEGRAAACEARVAQVEQVNGADGERNPAKSGVDSRCEQGHSIFYISTLVLREHAGDIGDSAVGLVGNWIARAGAVVVHSYNAGSYRNGGVSKSLFERPREAWASRAWAQKPARCQKQHRGGAQQRLRSMRIHDVRDEGKTYVYNFERLLSGALCPRNEAGSCKGIAQASMVDSWLAGGMDGSRKLNE